MFPRERGWNGVESFLPSPGEGRYVAVASVRVLSLGGVLGGDVAVGRAVGVVAAGSRVEPPGEGPAAEDLTILPDVHQLLALPHGLLVRGVPEGVLHGPAQDGPQRVDPFASLLAGVLDHVVGEVQEHELALARRPLELPLKNLHQILRLLAMEHAPVAQGLDGLGRGVKAGQLDLESLGDVPHGALRVDRSNAAGGGV